MSSIVDVLKAEINAAGPIRVSRYMELVLGHELHGYYMTRDPLGQRGDFTTAPEITQIFGELLGVWCIGIWRQMGKPPQFNIVEFGPGRGTLMKDLLRGASADKNFIQAMYIHLIETSPVLTQKQQETLQGKADHIEWHKSLETVSDLPTIFIGNEFLDALPINQYYKKSDGWHERKIGLSDGQFAFEDEKISDTDAASIIPRKVNEMEEKAVYEHNIAAQSIVRQISQRLEDEFGAALLIDYGYTEFEGADTLQSLHKHTKCGILEHVGDADVTAHVDFGTLVKCSGDVTPFLTTQRNFLQHLGLDMRMDMLIRENPGKASEIRDGAVRLIHPDQMGNLFKVLLLANNGMAAPMGF